MTLTIGIDRGYAIEVFAVLHGGGKIGDKALVRIAARALAAFLDEDGMEDMGVFRPDGTPVDVHNPLFDDCDEEEAQT